jgi:NAD(P)-dependent dehydrogenase (short-subunit alcohol dehydrogenase family)
MVDDTLLAGKVVAVTGAASGIGRATALLAARAGAPGVALLDQEGAALDAVAAEVRAAGVGVETVTADVADDHTGQLLVDRAVARFGRLDAAVNAAGTMGEPKELADYPFEVFDRVMRVNVRGVFGCMRAELGQMYHQGSGAIVNVASASVFGVHAELGPYIASKAALVAMSQVAAKEAGRHGVRVNTVCPGLTDTAMLKESMLRRPATTDIVSAIPLGRIGRPSELAEAIGWLCSDRASFTNGATLVVDGGRSG